MVQELDKQNHTTILKDMLEQAKLGKKHKHLLELEKTDIRDRIDTDVQEKTDGVFWLGNIFQEISENSHYLGGQRTDMEWKKKQWIFFAFYLANRHLLDKYGMEEER